MGWNRQEFLRGRSGKRVKRIPQLKKDRQTDRQLKQSFSIDRYFFCHFLELKCSGSDPQTLAFNQSPLI